MNDPNSTAKLAGNPGVVSSEIVRQKQINRSLVVNGSVWRAAWPLCLEVVVQWVTQDQWLVLASPDKSPSGGTAMCAVDHGSPVIKTFEQVIELLERWKAEKRPNHLAMISTDRVREYPILPNAKLTDAGPQTP